MSLFDCRTAKILATALVFALVVTVIYVARAAIVIFVASILFAYLIDPIVRFLQRHSLFFKNLRGPHITEAYLACIILVAVLGHVLAPAFHNTFAGLSQEIPAIADKVLTGEIANEFRTNQGWTDAQGAWFRAFLLRHRSYIETSLTSVEGSASGVIAGLFVIPILSIFFLSDGENLAHQTIFLLSTERSRPFVRSLAVDLHLMLQRYIRAKVTLGALSFVFCFCAMLLLRFPNALLLGVLAGLLEFIPVAGWMIAAATIVGAGALAHANWIWMLGLLCIWRILMDYAIYPRVMGHELEIHPLLAIFTAMVGGAIGGIIGVYLSVPAVAALRVVYFRFASHARDAAEFSAADGESSVGAEAIAERVSSGAGRTSG
ncbi:MAG TPA: AI-2E family transporter [Candidatus Eisenbacteria bacterium]|nr:AI-2E family transporter [Candidatus Eisenbacteria bacterium]